MFDMSSKNVGLATLIVLIAIMAFSALTVKPQFESPSLVFKEEPIEKNTEFQLQPGEQYVYSYVFNNTPINITYQVLGGAGCTAIRVAESVNSSETCVDKWGNDRGGYNSTLGNPQILLFKPWMLALNQGWHWNSSLYMSFNGSLQYMAGIEYRVLRIENYLGRPAFVVRENASNGLPQYEWIDVEKRVLLKLKGENYEITLTDGLPITN